VIVRSQKVDFLRIEKSVAYLPRIISRHDIVRFQTFVDLAWASWLHAIMQRM
jgi:hypothetical protein